MGDFFHGWRRKIGVVTLLIACGFATVWIRSLVVGDIVYLNVWDAAADVVSIDSHLVVTPFWTRADWYDVEVNWKPFQYLSSIEALYGSPFQWQYSFAGFGFCKKLDSRIFMVPYWSIVITMILLSAYLLLIKPRPSKPPESTNPPNEAQVPHA